ncbi:hypothetical protein VTL71DRAFT_3841 [Oculimacula yallundae]|uniref:Uncharacterized protein n=1 Tax=Oculimacula yallundae TaxID=86028 RepID=A0ABR4C6K2_9HELO
MARSLVFFVAWRIDAPVYIVILLLFGALQSVPRNPLHHKDASSFQSIKHRALRRSIEQQTSKNSLLNTTTSSSRSKVVTNFWMYIYHGDWHAVVPTISTHPLAERTASPAVLGAQTHLPIPQNGGQGVKRKARIPSFETSDSEGEEQAKPTKKPRKSVAEKEKAVVGTGQNEEACLCVDNTQQRVGENEGRVAPLLLRSSDLSAGDERYHVPFSVRVIFSQVLREENEISLNIPRFSDQIEAPRLGLQGYTRPLTAEVHTAHYGQQAANQSVTMAEPDPDPDSLFLPEGPAVKTTLTGALTVDGKVHLIITYTDIYASNKPCGLQTAEVHTAYTKAEAKKSSAVEPDREITKPAVIEAAPAVAERATAKKPKITAKVQKGKAAPAATEGDSRPRISCATRKTRRRERSEEESVTIRPGGLLTTTVVWSDDKTHKDFRKSMQLSHEEVAALQELRWITLNNKSYEILTRTKAKAKWAKISGDGSLQYQVQFLRKIIDGRVVKDDSIAGTATDIEEFKLEVFFEVNAAFDASAKVLLHGDQVASQ